MCVTWAELQPSGNIWFDKQPPNQPTKPVIQPANKPTNQQTKQTNEIIFASAFY